MKFKGIRLLNVENRGLLVFRFPGSTLCYLLTIERRANGTETAVCTKCLLHYGGTLAEDGKRLEKCVMRKGRKFNEDPRLFRHHGNCRPMGFDLTVNRLLRKNPANRDALARQRELLSANLIDLLGKIQPTPTTDAVGDAVSRSVVHSLDDSDSYCPALQHKEEPLVGTYPVKVIRRRHPATIFMFRLPEDPSKCYTFSISTSDSKCLYLTCSSCSTTCMRMRRSGLSPQTRKSRKCDGFSLKDDPRLNHVYGCVPLTYVNVLDKHIRVKNVEYIYGKIYDGFEVSPIQRKGLFFYLYVLEDDVSKCIRFVKSHTGTGLLKNGTVSTLCCSCKSERNSAAQLLNRQVKITIWPYMNGVLLKNPLLGHLGRCKPVSYSDVMAQYEYVDEETAIDVMRNLSSDYNDSELSNRTALLRKETSLSRTRRCGTLYFEEDCDDAQFDSSLCIGTG